MQTLKLRPPEPSESEVQKSIAATLRAYGWLVVRINGGGFKDGRGQFVRGYIVYGLNAACGFPDLVAFKGDRFLLIEVKKRGGVLGATQERFKCFAEYFGVRVHVLHDAREVPPLANAA
jgi:Holliday junction resolvase